MYLLRLFNDFLLLFFKPKSGIEKILHEKPSLHTIVYILFFIGLLRGVVEIIWLYLMKGQFQQFLYLLGSLDWYLFNAGPFIVCNIPTTYFLWSLTALIVFESGRFLGGEGEFVDILRIYGIFIFSNFLIAILNYLHYFVYIPTIRFRASEIFNPDIGIGQIVIFIWLVILTYQISRSVHRLSYTDSILIAFLPVLMGTVLYIFSIKACFNLIIPFLNINVQPFLSSLIIYTLSTIFLTFLFLYIGFYNQKIINLIYK